MKCLISPLVMLMGQASQVYGPFCSRTGKTVSGLIARNPNVVGDPRKSHFSFMTGIKVFLLDCKHCSMFWWVDRTNCLKSAYRVTKITARVMKCSTLKFAVSWSAYSCAVNILALSSTRDTTETDSPNMKEPTYKSILDPSVKKWAYPPYILSNSWYSRRTTMRDSSCFLYFVRERSHFTGWNTHGANDKEIEVLDIWYWSCASFLFYFLWGLMMEP